MPGMRVVPKRASTMAGDEADEPSSAIWYPDEDRLEFECVIDVPKSSQGKPVTVVFSGPDLDYFIGQVWNVNLERGRGQAS